jgi:hypothetical protein
MGVRILIDNEQDLATLYCSTSDWAFGPVVGPHDNLDKSPAERLEAFARWYVTDLRLLDEGELHTVFHQWLNQETDQYAKERMADLIKDEEDGVLLDHEVQELADLRTRFPEHLS